MANITTINVDNAINTLTTLYTSYIKSGTSIKDIPSVFLWGQPGVGKSESVFEIADNIHKICDKEVNVTDIRLVLYNPVDLRGIPSYDEERRFAVWLKPKILDLKESKDVVNIIFLDELTSAPTSIQSIAYQITLNKVIGEHHLPENTIVIAAGNRMCDNSVSFQMPKALANRMIHFQISSSLDSWIKWARANGVNEKIIKFLSFAPQYLNSFDPDSENVAFATPRTWKMVSDIMNTVSDDLHNDSVSLLISGLIGTGILYEFVTYIDNITNLPEIEAIVKGKNIETAISLDKLSSYTESLLYYVSNAKSAKEKETVICNIYKFAKTIPADYSAKLLDGILGTYNPEEYPNNPEIIEWAVSLSADYNIDIKKIKQVKKANK